ncbi:MAG: hypothetical protein E7177_00185 [Erysipelotrichaceae bacterium]|nr:hypothetical protein [Erysipelotrichaceae bacterium]
MKKISLIILLFCSLLTSCSKNEIYEYNKQILDTSYAANDNYLIVTNDGYQLKDKRIDFSKIINKKIMLDGRMVELLYGTRSQKTLVGDSLYFCYEYKRKDDIGHHAIGYVDLNTSKVYVDYFDYERYMFDYNFSTDKFVCYTFKEEINSPEVIDIVFFKDTNKLEFDYDLSKLSYDLEDIEEPNIKDYYIEGGVKYTLDNFKRTLTNTVTGEVNELPYQNDLLELESVIKEMYSKFEYNQTAIIANYFSTGNELFLSIHDRPTNKLNAPFLIFKCNLDMTKIEYIGYSEYTINAVVNLTNDNFTTK